MQSLARRAEPNTGGNDEKPARRRRRFGAFDGLGALALAAFAAALWSDRTGLAAGRGEVALHVDPQALADGFREGVAWHGMYRDGTKVGFSRTERRRRGAGFATEHTLVLPVPGLPGHQTVTIATELSAAFQLERFSADVHGGPLDVRAEGRWQDGVLHIDIHGLPGGDLAHDLPMTEPPQMDQSFLPLVTRDDLARGDRFSYAYVDPLSATPSTAVVEVMGRESLDVLGERVDALRLRQEISGQRLDVWVNPLGEVLQQTLPGGLLAVRQSEAEATWGVDAR